MNKLLKHLEDEVYCRISVSKIKGAGVGVIAIRDIPKGINPFQIAGQDCIAFETVKIPFSEVKKLNPGVKKIIKDFISPGNDYYELPKMGLNNLEISFYMNHSKTPNMEIWYSNKCPYNLFRTNRRIKKGEELVIDYNQLV
jgi:SET domain-containing protein